MAEKKYGLVLRAPKPQKKPQLTRPTLPTIPGFNDDDDDNDVEQDISRQAARNKSLKDVEEQHKKAMEEDPSVFDYDGVYDDMKSKLVQPKAQDQQQRESKYIRTLMEKAKRREREQEIVYEKKLAKERSNEEHLFADKDKFVTSAYKRKLAEQEKWLMEEKLREKLEERDDVTKKSDLSDFYFNLTKNVAYGAADKTEAKKPDRLDKEPVALREELKKPEKHGKESSSAAGEMERPSTSSAVVSPLKSRDRPRGEAPERSPEHKAKPAPHPDVPAKEDPDDQAKRDHHKKTEDALAAAKERFLSRKRAKVE